MDANELYDVIVVGGGPGGATVAYYLGEAGRQVLVLEKWMAGCSHNRDLLSRDTKHSHAEGT